MPASSGRASLSAEALRLGRQRQDRETSEVGAGRQRASVDERVEHLPGGCDHELEGVWAVLQIELGSHELGLDLARCGEDEDPTYAYGVFFAKRNER
jgi:hypothetical protein